MNKNLMLVIIVILLTGTLDLTGQPVQWRGPDRDGKYPDTGLLKEWPEGGPELVLKKEGLGGGYSTPVLYDGIIYVTGRRDTLEVITALNLNGDVLWETIYGRPWMESFQETRNTPAIEEGRIYITGAMGTVNCIDAETGHILWSQNTHKAYDAGFHRWGMAESVLLTEDAVISSPVGEQTVMVALDKDDGSVIWETKSVGGVRSYVSPLMIEYNGVELIIATTSEDLVGIDPSTGEIFWVLDIVTEYTEKGKRISTNTPVYHDGEIFVSSGYDDQALMVSLSDDCRSASVKWTSDVLDNHHGGMVYLDGYLYGSNWLNNGNGNWVCLDWDTGEVMYEEKWHNKGAMIYADGMFYVFEEKQGYTALVEPSPEGFFVKGSFSVDDGRGPRWAHPSIYDKKLFLRHHDVLLVYDIAAD
ncbi:MAG: PQQ-like beta-propeller repeat protein [Bacteroidales bacterium]|nr:PQQ-like beta-propeller repeat protein [Bacteroidales bacterium]